MYPVWCCLPPGLWPSTDIKTTFYQILNTVLFVLSMQHDSGSSVESSRNYVGTFHHWINSIIFTVHRIKNFLRCSPFSEWCIIEKFARFLQIASADLATRWRWQCSMTSRSEARSSYSSAVIEVIRSLRASPTDAASRSPGDMLYSEAYRSVIPSEYR